MIDEGNREGLRIEVGRSISATRVVRVMNELIEFYGKPEAIRLDNGPELTSEYHQNKSRPSPSKSKGKQSSENYDRFVL